MLPDGLPKVLDRIVAALLKGTLGKGDDYGTLRFRGWFTGNSTDNALKVLEYLNGQVENFTEGRSSVVFVDRRLVDFSGMKGLTLACVPMGKGVDSPEAQYFCVAPAEPNAFFVQLNSPEVMARIEQLEVERRS